MASAQWQATRWPAGTPGQLDDAQLRPLVVAPGLLPPRAAGVEAAAASAGCEGEGRSPVSRICSRVSSTVGSGTGTADSRARGVRVQRLRVEVVGGGLLDHPAEVHDADPVADVPHDGQVVGDDEVGEVELVLQLLEQVDHLRLHRDVEGRDRLVGDDELGLDGQRPGDADPLALAAGELVRVLRQRGGGQADGREQLAQALLGRRLRRCRGRAPACPRRAATRPTGAGRGCSSGPGRPSGTPCAAAAAPRPSGSRCRCRRRRRCPRSAARG